MPSETLLGLAFEKGSAYAMGYGQWGYVSFPTFTDSDATWSVALDSTQGTTIIGRDDVGLWPYAYSFALTLGYRVFLANGTKFNLSALNNPTAWSESWQSNEIGTGSFDLLTHFGGQDSIMALASYQGKLAVIGTNQSQIWSIDADPTLCALGQVLPNVGTVAAKSVCSLGDLDVLMLSYSGIRSIRARESTLNAIVTDIGSAVDKVVTGKLDEATSTQKAAANAYISPESNRYNLFLRDTFYVLSYFPTSKITAWSTYLPSYAVAGVQTTFVSEKTVILRGQTFTRAANGKILRYGGELNASYDSSVAIVETPWLDCGKAATVKEFFFLDVACEGAWKISIKCNPSEAWREVWSGGSDTAPAAMTDSTFNLQKLSAKGMGTHIKIRAISQGSTNKATLSALVIHYDKRNSG